MSSSERISLYNSGNGAKANTVAKANITAYFDGSSATGVNLASDAVEYDLPENTLFEETDTRKIYWLQSNTWNAGYSLTFSDDFSTTSNWTADSSGQCSITGGHVVINPSSGSYSSGTFNTLRHDMQDDLGSGTNLSDTSWTITFGIDATSYSGGANSDYMDWQFVVTSATTNGSNKSICFGSSYTQSGGGGTELLPRYIGSVKDGQDNISGLVTTSVNDRRENSSAGTTHTFPLPSTTQGGGSDGKFWIKMQRTAATQFKIYIYNDEAMTSQNSVWTTTDTSLCQELTDLRYLNVYAYQQNSDSWTNEATLDDVKVYDGQVI